MSFYQLLYWNISYVCYIFCGLISNALLSMVQNLNEFAAAKTESHRTAAATMRFCFEKY